MESEQEDVRKITEFINKQKSGYQNNFQLEFQDFVNFKQDYNDIDFDEELSNDEEITNDSEDDIKDISIRKLPVHLPNSTLTEEERDVIESCRDPELKRLLILNRSKNMQLIGLHKKIRDLLIECEEAMEEKNTVLKNLETKQISQQTCIWKLAAPYFKDKQFFSCPLNEDTLRKRSGNELSVYDLIPPSKWTPIEFDRLINAVKCNYNTNRQTDVVRRLNALKAAPDNVEDNDKSKIFEILGLETQLQELKDDNKIPPLNLNKFINWYKVSEIFLKDKRTASECQSVWHMLVHPQINKSDWTEEENKNLESIAKRHSYQNWDDIAVELNTQRTGFTTCLHYFSKLCDKFKKNKFTADEDKFLLEIVDGYKIGSFIPWNKVVCHFNNRSRHQLYCRYTYFLSQHHVKKGKFTEAEDILLMILVGKFGKNFKKCAEYMPHRSQVQLKSRYSSNLQRQIKKGTFTAEDDQKIVDYVQKYGEKRWCGLTEQLHRCNAQIRQRYKIIKAFLAANPEGSVSDIPKRKHRFDNVNDDQYSFLNYMVDQYKDVEYIPTVTMIEESLQMELKTPCPVKPPQKKLKRVTSDVQQKKVKLKNIDTMLTDFFSSSMKIKQHRNITEVNLVEASNNVEEILSVLGAKLNIPKGFECNIHLDDIDVEILEILSRKNSRSNTCNVDRLISPNINTLVGLRSLIIKHKNYKLQQKSKNVPNTLKSESVMWPIEQNLLALDETDREEILSHRKRFSKRFDAVFNWSAVLSLEKPNQFNSSEETNPNEIQLTSTRTYTRRASEQAENIGVKKRKIDVSDLTNFSQQPNINSCQLKLVDKSVVEKLMQNKNNISIIRIESVAGPDGVIRPIIQQNHSDNDHGMAQPNSINNFSNTDDVMEDVVNETEDLEDVQKLNVILKSVKSEVINDSPSCSSDEYRSIQDDVQLLKEILSYEKIQIKADPDGFS